MHWNFGWLWVDEFPNLIYTWIFVCHRSFYKQCDFLAQDTFRDVRGSRAVENRGGSALIFPADCSWLFTHAGNPALWDWWSTQPTPGNDRYATCRLPASSHFLAALGVKSLSGSDNPACQPWENCPTLRDIAGRGMLAKACSFLECRWKDRRNNTNRHMSQQSNTRQGLHTWRWSEKCSAWNHLQKSSEWSMSWPDPEASEPEPLAWSLSKKHPSVFRAPPAILIHGQGWASYISYCANSY